MKSEEIEVCAKEGTRIENEMGRAAAAKAFTPAILFSFIYSLACIMEGFDTILISNFFALPQFKQDFGCREPGSVRSVRGDCEIPGGYQAGLMISALIGQIIGIILSGWFTEKYGYRKTFVGALGAMSAAIFVVFFAPSLSILVAGELLCGIPWGVFQTLSASYSSDVCITSIRAYATSWNNLCWVIGQLVASGIQQPLVNNRTALSYKLPLGLQWVWPVVILLLLVISRAPESPWWLVRKGRTRDALKAVEKLSRRNSLPSGYTAYNHVATIVVTNEHEKNDKDNGTGSTGYRDCFRGVNLRRTLVCCIVWAAQNACGSSLMQASTYFLTQNGINEESAFNFTIGQVSLYLISQIAIFVNSPSPPLERPILGFRTQANGS
jgi:SP family general alpha glucoside:H+ symporter-like MFS transporter